MYLSKTKEKIAEIIKCSRKMLLKNNKKMNRRK